MVEIATLVKTAAEGLMEAEKKKLIDNANYERLVRMEIQGRMNGLVEGRLKRLLEEGLDAATANPPVWSVTKERVEYALDLLKKEKEWLDTKVNKG